MGFMFFFHVVAEVYVSICLKGVWKDYLLPSMPKKRGFPLSILYVWRARPTVNFIVLNTDRLWRVILQWLISNICSKCSVLSCTHNACRPWGKLGKVIGTGLDICACVVAIQYKQSGRPLPLGVCTCMCAWKGNFAWRGNAKWSLLLSNE